MLWRGHRPRRRRGPTSSRPTTTSAVDRTNGSAGGWSPCTSWRTPSSCGPAPGRSCAWTAGSPPWPTGTGHLQVEAAPGADLDVPDVTARGRPAAAGRRRLGTPTEELLADQQRCDTPRHRPGPVRGAPRRTLRRPPQTTADHRAPACGAFSGPGGEPHDEPDDHEDGEHPGGSSEPVHVLTPEWSTTCAAAAAERGTTNIRAPIPSRLSRTIGGVSVNQCPNR